MNIWSSEIKELEQVSKSIKGAHPELEKELEKLISSDDENMLLVYSRRCLEVIITQLCECELKRKRGTEPLQRIIDKLNKEEKVPHNIIVSMQAVNSMSTFGAHPKEFELKQVKPVLSNLETIINWYVKYRNVKADGPAIHENTNQPTGQKPYESKKKRFLLIGAILVCVTIVTSLILFNVFDLRKQVKTNLIDSIVVLPISNFTGQDSMEWLADGMHASLIQDMSKIRSLRITGKTTSRTYRNSNKTIKEITNECNTDAALELDLLCLGEDSICLQTRLIETGLEEKQIWTNDYKIARNEITKWYMSVSKQIAKGVNIELTPAEEKLLTQSVIVDREAYEAYLRSHQYLEDYSLESLNKAREYLNLAIEKDPNWAPLYAGLAKVWMGLSQFGFVSPEIAGSEFSRNVNKALELDPDHADAHYLNAMVAYLSEWNWEKSEREFLKVIAINPNDAYSRIYYAHLLYILQRPDEAAVQARLAYDLDPLDPTILVTYAASLLCADDCKAAMIHAEKAMEIDPGSFLAYNQINSVTFRCKDYNRTFETDMFILKSLSRKEIDENTFEEIEHIFLEQGYFAAYEKIMSCYERLANKGLVGAGTMAINYITGKYQGKALDYLEKGYEIHDPQMPYIGSGGYPFHSLYNNPRFIAILEKMNLPLPKTD